jgi:hypothetical protein
MGFVYPLSLLYDHRYTKGDDVIQHLIIYPTRGLYFGALYHSLPMFCMSGRIISKELQNNDDEKTDLFEISL